MELNPHHPRWYELTLAINEYRLANYRGAIDAVTKANAPEVFWGNVVLAAAYGQLGDLPAAHQALRDLLIQKTDFGQTAPEMLAKWMDPQLCEQLLDGLRKAGLEISDQERLTTSSPVMEMAPMAESSPSIAVLPFINISNDPDNDYFCDGLAEELLNALSKIDELKVAARTSAFSFKGKNANVNEIGKKLNVKNVLEGSVRKSGNRVRITTQLINAADGYHLWSERYDRELKDIFDVHDEITVAVVEALKVKLLGEEKAAVLKRHTRNPEAYEFYLRGLSYFNRWTPDDFQQAIDSFRQAIAIDPDYAVAYAALANAYTELAFFSLSPPSDCMTKAREASNKALDLDDTLGEAHTSLAIIKMYYDWDFAGAEREYTRALALDPGSAHVHMWYGFYLGLMGRFDEGLKELQHAWELDPLSDPINLGIGIVFHWSGQPERAIERLRKVLEMNPTYYIAYPFLIEAYEQKGDLVSALAEIEKVPHEVNDAMTLSAFAHAYAKSGNRQKALEILKQLEQRSIQAYVPAFNIAQIHVGLGDNEQAFAWLDKACDEHSLWLSWLRVDRKFDPLRSDSRFQDVLRRIGLAQ
jgi:serine/threonine-protein kinase